MKTQQWHPFKSDLQIIFVVLQLPTANYYSQKGGNNESSSVCAGIGVIRFDMHVSHKKKQGQGPKHHIDTSFGNLFILIAFCRHHHHMAFPTAEMLRIWGIFYSFSFASLCCLFFRFLLNVSTQEEWEANVCPFVQSISSLSLLPCHVLK